MSKAIEAGKKGVFAKVTHEEDGRFEDRRRHRRGEEDEVTRRAAE